MQFYLLIIFFLVFDKLDAMDLLDHQNRTINVFSEKWEFFSDKVMGGVSEGSLAVINENNLNFLRLKGQVSTKNNGGFIQFRSKVDIESNNLKNIKFKIRGQPSEYFVHIRTDFLFLPWQYYAGVFNANDQWTEVIIPFQDFKKSNFYQPSNFSSSEIISIGFVAYGKNFNAQLDLLELELTE